VKLWRIPAPWDYHKRAEILVLADDAASALEKARRAAEYRDANDKTYGWRESGYTSLEAAIADDHWGLRWARTLAAEAHLVENEFYTNNGCDC
jgi:hypothetical protein